MKLSSKVLAFAHSEGDMLAESDELFPNATVVVVCELCLNDCHLAGISRRKKSYI